MGQDLDISITDFIQKAIEDCDNESGWVFDTHPMRFQMKLAAANAVRHAKGRMFALEDVQDLKEPMTKKEFVLTALEKVLGNHLEKVWNATNHPLEMLESE